MRGRNFGTAFGLGCGFVGLGYTLIKAIVYFFDGVINPSLDGGLTIAFLGSTSAYCMYAAVKLYHFEKIATTALMDGIPGDI